MYTMFTCTGHCELISCRVGTQPARQYQNSPYLAGEVSEGGQSGLKLILTAPDTRRKPSLDPKGYDLILNITLPEYQ